MEPATALLLHLFCSVCAGLYTSTPSPHPPQVSTPSVWEQPGSEQSECSLQVEPPELVVRFGDPVSVSCSNSQEAVLGWEGLQEPTEPVMGAFLSWTEESLSRWDIEPKCYALTVVGQCALNLSLTVYQPPNSVSLSFRDQGVEVDGLLLMADSLYTLHCEVEAVAPAELLTVRFYRNHKELGSRSGQSTLKSPVNQSLSLDYRLSREDHRALFYCEASLELGPGGPQPGPLLRSQNITADVHYAPRSAVSEPEFLTIVQGQTVELDCSSDGNPDPQYSWSGPSLSEPLSGSSVFTVGSASSQHQGQYFCNASNSRGTVQRVFTVTVTVNYMPVLVVVLLAALILIAVISYLFHRHRDHYSLRDLLCLHNHNAVLTTA